MYRLILTFYFLREREELLGLKKEIHKLKRTELNEGYDEEDEEHEEEEDEEDEEEEEKIEKPKIEQQKNTSPPHGEINIPENARYLFTLY